MADVNVLLTCAGQRVDIVRAFRAVLGGDGPHRGRVLVSDLDPLSPALFAADAVVELPAVSDPGYGAAVAEACRAEGVRAVLPLTDLDPVVLAQAAEGIRAAGAQVFLPDAHVALGCQDKWECHLMLQAHGLPSPPTWLPDEVDPAELPYPVLLKPRLGFAGRHIHRCADPDELAFFRRYSPAESVVQRALPGLEFSIDCLGDLDGRALGAVPRAMIQSKGGEQIKGETLDDPQLVELAAATVEALRLAGPSTIQCFREDGRVLGITDINTRFGGAFPLPQAAGAGYPAAIVAIAAGERPAPRLGEHRPGVVMTRFLDQTILERGAAGLAPVRPVV
ncbi:ATP-grasp domain-containing protein [Miltoncostaea marina]|uniref:ATP-grasp domain-containing protein n=1 Tax=Miltoncostaea marina TaxID=2843215 RepID=UPI001C3C9042|nr:ATP-grasp domain-containing protein [Miltoncostaea marina]